MMRAADTAAARRAALGRARQAQRSYELAGRKWFEANDARKASMTRAIQDGLTYTEAGAVFGVTRSYVSNVVANRQGRGAR